MKDRYIVNVVYHDKNLAPVSERTYTLREYTEMISMDLRRVIQDVEDAFYNLKHGKSKNEWDEETQEAFNKIRHKQLDKAGEIQRLPANIAQTKRYDRNITNVEDLVDLIETAFEYEE